MVNKPRIPGGILIYIYIIGEFPGLHIKVRLGVEQRKGRCASL